MKHLINKAANSLANITKPINKEEKKATRAQAKQDKARAQHQKKFDTAFNKDMAEQRMQNSAASGERDCLHCGAVVANNVLDRELCPTCQVNVKAPVAHRLGVVPLRKSNAGVEITVSAIGSGLSAAKKALVTGKNRIKVARTVRKNRKALKAHDKGIQVLKTEAAKLDHEGRIQILNALKNYTPTQK